MTWTKVLLLLAQLGEIPSYLNEGTTTFLFERGKKEDDGNTDPSASPLWPLQSWKRFCWKICQCIWKIGDSQHGFTTGQLCLTNQVTFYLGGQLNSYRCFVPGLLLGLGPLNCRDLWLMDGHTQVSYIFTKYPYLTVGTSKDWCESGVHTGTNKYFYITWSMTQKMILNACSASLWMASSCAV